MQTVGKPIWFSVILNMSFCTAATRGQIAVLPSANHEIFGNFLFSLQGRKKESLAVDVLNRATRSSREDSK